ncbi:MAG TPA: phosphatase, partial [Nocardioides sp.]|nr:phosphatase [Nocardioides sp.]
MTSTRPETRALLPLLPTGGEYRHGSRSHLTCLYRCGNACDQPLPNQSTNGHVQAEIAKALGRRAVLRGAAVGSGALVLTAAGGAP